MFQSFGQGRRPMRAKPAKRVADVGVRFLRSRAAVLGGNLAANDNARLARRPAPIPEPSANGIERRIAPDERENRRPLVDLFASAVGKARAEAEG